jgi:chromosome segregation ATPase
MATDEPSGDSPPGDDSPKDNQDNDGAPQVGRPTDRSEDRKKQISRLLARLDSEQKRSERLRGLLDEGKESVKKLNTHIQENNAHCSAKLERLKGKVEGQNATVKAVKQAASDTARIKELKAKELLEAKDVRHKDTMAHHRCTMKELLFKKEELAKSSDKLNNLERKFCGLNRDLVNVIREKESLKKETATLKSTNAKAKAAISSQLEGKLAHQKSMAKLRLQKEKVSLALERAKKSNKTSRRQEEFDAKRDYFACTTATRANEKDKDIERKESAKRMKADESIKKLGCATSQMHRTTALNGGSFPNPARTSLAEVSVCVRRTSTNHMHLTLPLTLSSFNFYRHVPP